MMKIIGGVGAFCVFAYMGANATMQKNSYNGAPVYAEADAQTQAEMLQMVADDFERSFESAAQGQAELKSIKIVPEQDLVDITVRYTNKQIEFVGGSQLSELRQTAMETSCKQARRDRKVYESVTLRVDMLKPSGAPLMRMTLNKKNCERALGAS